MPARRIDDTKIDKLEELLREQTGAINEIAVSVARIEERLDSFNEKIAKNEKEIDGVKANQRWAALAIIGAFLSSAVNFFFSKGN